MTDARAPLLFAVGLWAILVAVGLTLRPALPVDETRYLAVAWEMWQRGDFLVPHLNGQAYHHKPPLLFWAMQAGWAVFGVSETWARLVAPLFALGSVLLTARLGRMLWPQYAALGPLASMILAGSALFALFASLTFFDTLVTFFALLGWIGLALAWGDECARQSPWRGWALFAIALGLGVLSKGPVQLLYALPAALLAPLWMARERPSISHFRRRWYTGLGLAFLGGAAIALVWAIPAALAGGPDFARKIFLGQHTGRMVESFQHARPFWWYVPIAFLIFFPWLWWPALWSRFPLFRAAWPEPGMRFCLAIIAPAFIAFSAISGKQPHYLLPLLPPAALIMARLLTEPIDDRVVRRLPPLLVVLAAAIAVVVAPFALHHIPAVPPELYPSGLITALIVVSGLALGSLALWLLFDQTRVSSARAATLALLAPAALTAVHVAFLALRPGYDGAGAAAVLHEAEMRGRPIAFLYDYIGQYTLAARLQHPVAEIGEDDVSAWARQHPNGVIAGYRSDAPAQSGALYQGPYRGRTLVIWGADQVLSQGAAIVTSRSR